MRTREQIKKALNPDDHKGGHWTYVPVKYSGYTMNGVDLGEEWCQIHEVFFTENGDPRAYSTEAVKVCGNDLEDMKGSLQMMLDACNKEVITKEELDLIVS